MQEAITSGGDAGLGEIPRSLDGDPDEIRPGPPVADAGRGVVDHLDAGAGLLEGCLVGQVALDELDPLALSHSTSLPCGEHADRPAAKPQLLDDMTA